VSQEWEADQADGANRSWKAGIQAQRADQDQRRSKQQAERKLHTRPKTVSKPNIQSMWGPLGRSRKRAGESR